MWKEFPQISCILWLLLAVITTKTSFNWLNSCFLSSESIRLHPEELSICCGPYSSPSAVSKSSQLLRPLFWFSKCHKDFLSFVPPEVSTQEPSSQWHCLPFWVYILTPSQLNFLFWISRSIINCLVSFHSLPIDIALARSQLWCVADTYSQTLKAVIYFGGSSY